MAHLVNKSAPSPMPVAHDGRDAAAARESALIADELIAMERKRWQLRTTEIAGPGIYIVAKIEGFRRAGLEHCGFKRYPLDAFTAAQLAQLTTDRHLEVFTVGGEAIPREGGLPAVLPLGTSAISTAALDRAEEAAAAEDAHAADAGIKGQAARDVARENARSRR